jgi:hypothetical protein
MIWTQTMMYVLHVEDASDFVMKALRLTQSIEC